MTGPSQDDRHVADVAVAALNSVRQAFPELTGSCRWMIGQIAEARAKTSDGTSVNQGVMGAEADDDEDDVP